MSNKSRQPTFVIIHGAFGSPQGNWFPQLKDSLKTLGQKVLAPQFPIDDYDAITKAGPKKAQNKKQTLQNWLKVFETKVLPKIKNKPVVFIGHSLAPLFILHLVDKYNLTIDSCIFVSPFLKDLKRKDLWQFKLVNQTFYKQKFDFKELRQKIPESFVIYSDNDPYVDVKFMLEFAEKMHSSKIKVKHAGHLNSESGFNNFPLITELCKARLNLDRPKE